jgi:hypothetical protein
MEGAGESGTQRAHPDLCFGSLVEVTERFQLTLHVVVDRDSFRFLATGHAILEVSQLPQQRLSRLVGKRVSCEFFAVTHSIEEVMAAVDVSDDFVAANYDGAFVTPTSQNLVLDPR